MATNKRGWHIPMVNVPESVGSGAAQGESGGMTYFLVIIPALMLVFRSRHGFSGADGASSIAEGETRIRRTRVRLIIVSSLVIVAIVQLIPRRAR